MVDELFVHIAAANASLYGQLVVDTSSQLMDASREHSVLRRNADMSETTSEWVESVTMPLILFKVSTLSMKSFLSSRPANPASPYLHEESKSLTNSDGCWSGQVRLRSLPFQDVHCLQHNLGRVVQRKRISGHNDGVVRDSHGLVDAPVDQRIEVRDQAVRQVGVDATLLPDQAVSAVHFIDGAAALGADPDRLDEAEAEYAAATLGMLVAE